MLPTSKRLNLVSFEKFRSPIYVSKGKEKYVYFYVLDPDSVLNGEPRLKRIRKKFNHIKTKKERDEAVAMSCKLGTLWNNGNFENRQSLQKLLFPTGILYDKENDGYRTDNENEVFKIFRRLSVSYEDKKEKATSEIIRLSPSVGKRRLERPTPTSRT